MDTRLQSFIDKYKGVAGVGNTPENKGQCVGLVSLWMDVLGISHEWGNAKDLLNNADTTKFAVIKNDPNNLNQFPSLGDVMVWDGTWGNGDGHTGVVVSANGISSDCFEQNNPTGSAPKINHHNNYNGVLGWLHPLQQGTVGNYYKGIDLTNQESIKVCVDVWDDVTQGRYVPVAEMNAIALTLGLPAGSSKDAIVAELVKLQKGVNDASLTADNLNKQVPVLATQAEANNAEITMLKQQLESEKKLSQNETGQSYKDLYLQITDDYSKDKIAWTNQFRTDAAVFSQLKRMAIAYLSTKDILNYWISRVVKQTRQGVPPPLTPEDFKYAENVVTTNESKKGGESA